MSQQYDLYLKNHKANVKKGFDWLQTNMPWLFEGRPSATWQTEFEHDASKSNPDEYEAYDAYFYGGNRSHAVVEAFNRASTYPPQLSPLAALGSDQRRPRRRGSSAGDAL